MLSNQLKEREAKKQEFRQQYMRSLITKREAAKELGCSSSTIDRMRIDGLISSKKIRGKIMFSLDEITRLIVEGC